jgi:hypothetical protein
MPSGLSARSIVDASRARSSDDSIAVHNTLGRRAFGKNPKPRNSKCSSWLRRIPASASPSAVVCSGATSPMNFSVT